MKSAAQRQCNGLESQSRVSINTLRILFRRTRRLPTTPRILFAFNTILRLEHNFRLPGQLPLPRFFRIVWARPVLILTDCELFAFTIFRVLDRKVVCRVISFSDVFTNILSVRSTTNGISSQFTRWKTILTQSALVPPHSSQHSLPFSHELAQSPQRLYPLLLDLPTDFCRTWLSLMLMSDVVACLA